MASSSRASASTSRYKLEKSQSLSPGDSNPHYPIYDTFTRQELLSPWSSEGRASSVTHGESGSVRPDKSFSSNSPSYSSLKVSGSSSRRKPSPSFEPPTPQDTRPILVPDKHSSVNVERLAPPHSDARSRGAPERSGPPPDKYTGLRKSPSRPKTADSSFMGDWHPAPPSSQLRAKHSRSNLSDAGSYPALRSSSESSSRHLSSNRLAPSAPLPLAPLHNTRSSSAPNSNSYHRSVQRQPSSGTISEGGTMIPVDMKRLLSKPALPSNSGASVISDSERSYVSQTNRSPVSTSSSRPAVNDGREVRPTLVRHPSGPREKPISPRAASQLILPSPLTTPTPSRRPSSSSGHESRSRNVLRRKPSGARLAPHSAQATPTASSFSTVTPSRSFTGSSLTVDLGSSSRRSSSRDTQRSKEASPSARLTPAGAVAQAYKRQEKRRSELEAYSLGSGPEHVESVNSSPNSPEAAMPYYTVLGSTSGRVVAIGSPEDDAWNLNVDAYYPSDGRAKSGKMSVDVVRRSLSRKVSQTWKKASIGGMKKEVSPAGRSENAERPSLQERRSSISRHRTKPSLHLSIDGYVDLSPPSSTPSASNGTPASDGKRREKDEEGGGKLWKLVKRISTGGLRDKYHDPPPPVPALPKGLIGRSTPCSPESEASPPSVLSRFHSRPSVVSPVSHKKSPVLVSAGGHRPSTTTRSSSPGSSDVASSRFFQRPQSTRSSSSSYGEELPPPVPKPQLAQHIIPPSELNRINREFEKEQAMLPANTFRSPKRSASGPDIPSDTWFAHVPEERRPSLPFPPRRQAVSSRRTSVSSQDSMDSPVIPSFTTAAAINAFESRKSSMDSNGRPTLSIIVPSPELGILQPQPHPPPLPRKSSRRRAPRTPPGTPSLRVDEDGASRNPNRKSSGAHSTASTARPRHRSSSFGAGHSPLTFREMGSAEQRSALSEQEKADRWDDLLERSAKAGGTLHLGGAELMSERFRFSNISETFS